jgi:P-type Ca2+ transporter type 2C
VELHMLQRLLDTTSLTGGEWGTVLGLSLIAPAIVGVDKAIQLRRQRSTAGAVSQEPTLVAEARA